MSISGEKSNRNDGGDVVQSLICVWLFATPWTAAHQASLSFTISQILLKLMPIESMMPSNKLILCCPLLLLPLIFPSIRVFSSELALHIRWPKYWSFSFSISPSNEYSVLILERLLLRAICYAWICDLQRTGFQSRVRDEAWLLGAFCVAKFYY